MTLGKPLQHRLQPLWVVAVERNAAPELAVDPLARVLVAQQDVGMNLGANPLVSPPEERRAQKIGIVRKADLRSLFVRT